MVRFHTTQTALANAFPIPQKLLTMMAETVRTARNQFGRDLPPILLSSIFSFISSPFAHRSRSVCKLWRDASTSPLPKKIMNMRPVIGASYARSWKTSLEPRAIALIGSTLYVGEMYAHEAEVWSPVGILLGQLKVTSLQEEWRVSL